MYSSAWFGPDSFINPDRPVHLPVNLGNANLTGSDILVLYFLLAPFHPSEFEAFLAIFLCRLLRLCRRIQLAFPQSRLDLVYGPIGWLSLSCGIFKLCLIHCLSTSCFRWGNTTPGKIFREILKWHLSLLTRWF